MSDDAAVLALFERLLDLDADARAAALERETAGRPALRSRLLALLAHDARAHPLLDADTAEIERRLRGVAPDTADAANAPDAPDPANAPAPDAIAGYRIVRELGRGGMGIVYLAERTNVDFRQQVALKIVAADPDAAALAERLRRERRILAQLRHPNIAQLVDGGVTPAGLPYIVMEYIEGERIDRWCDARRLDVRARVRLFLSVCGAVEHLQQQRVVHRDLKPSNLLVTADGVVKLLDFGIAKAIAGSAAPGDRAAVTRTRLTAFTPGYASPEQLRDLAVTAASDVYALGVILYELLTGVSPYPARDDPFEAARAVLETDPLPPSDAVSARDAGHADRAGARGTTPDRLRRALRGDLDAIVQHAMQRRPQERYPDAHALRQDLERYLALAPVHARRRTRAYRLRRFAQRHRTAVAAGAAAVVLGTAVSTLVRSPDAEPAIAAHDHLVRGDIALAARTPDDVRRAINQYAAAAAAAPSSAEPLFREAYAWLVSAAWGWQHPALDDAGILERAAELVERGLVMEPRSAEGLLALGYLRTLRDPDRLSGAVASFEASLARDDRNVEAWHQYGQALMVLDRFDDAARAYREALRREPRRAMTLVPLAAMALYRGRMDEARAWADSAVAVSPANSYARASRARILLAAGDTAGARAEAELAAGVDQGHAVTVRATLAAAYAASDAHAKARAVYDALPRPDDAGASPSAVDAAALALAALAVGDTAHALDVLARARPRGAWLRFYLRAPHFDGVRHLPAFRAIAGPPQRRSAAE